MNFIKLQAIACDIPEIFIKTLLFLDNFLENNNKVFMKNLEFLINFKVKT